MAEFRDLDRLLRPRRDNAHQVPNEPAIRYLDGDVACFGLRILGGPGHVITANGARYVTSKDMIFPFATLRRFSPPGSVPCYKGYDGADKAGDVRNIHFNESAGELRGWFRPYRRHFESIYTGVRTTPDRWQVHGSQYIRSYETLDIGRQRWRLVTDFTLQHVTLVTRSASGGKILLEDELFPSKRIHT